MFKLNFINNGIPADLEAANVCPPGWVLCGLDGGCIDSKYLCDGDQNCPDNSDELNCYGMDCF